MKRSRKAQPRLPFRPNARIQWMVYAAALLALGLIYRLFDIQWIRTEEFKSLSNQTVGNFDENIQRGGIWDRKGRELAVSKNKYSISVDTRYYKDLASRYSAGFLDRRKKKMAEILAAHHPQNASPADMLKKIESARGFEYVIRWIDPPQFEALERELKENDFRWSPKGALKEKVESSRAYPRGTLASHVVGFTNIDGKGIDGVELTYDKTIRARTVKRTGVKDARGRIIDLEVIKGGAPKRAEGVVLTIDQEIQFALENALETQVAEHKAAGAVGIVMDPRSGDVLAMANYPTYDPNLYNDPSLKKESKRNQAIWSPYEPGSVFKALTIAALIESDRVVDLNEIIFCENGSFKPAPRIKPIRDSHPYGDLTVAEVIYKSSNIGVTKLARRMTQDEYREQIKQFLVHQKTNIDLPYERSGSIRDLYNRAGFAINFAPWGQGISMTPIQLLTAFNAIANKGVIMQPRVVQEMRNQNGETVEKIKPEKIGQPISARTARIVTELLVGVVEEGTGRAVQVEGVPIAGKTGTSQKASPHGGGYKRGSYISSFAGFFPAYAPEYSMIILIDEPRSGAYYGGAVAGPAFKAVVEAIMRNKRIASSNPFLYEAQADE